MSKPDELPEEPESGYLTRSHFRMPKSKAATKSKVAPKAKALKPAKVAKVVAKSDKSVLALKQKSAKANPIKSEASKLNITKAAPKQAKVKVEAKGKDAVKSMPKQKGLNLKQEEQGKAALEKEGMKASQDVNEVTRQFPKKPLTGKVKPEAKVVPVAAETETSASEAATEETETVVTSNKKVKLDISANDSSDKLSKKWQALYKKAQGQKTEPYNMKNRYESQTAILHKILGWGFILDNKNDRLEVLFQDGIKYLISNYKP